MSEELFSGWAADAPIEDSLLRRFVFALADRGPFLAERLGCPELRTEAVAAVDPGSPVIFDNIAVLLQPPAMVDVRAVVAQVLDFFPPERSFVLMSAWPIEDLSAAGLKLMGHPPFMFRPVGGDAPPPPAGLRIEEVADGTAADIFVRTLQEAYPMPGEGSPVFDHRILGGPIRLFTGFEGDRPIGTAGTIVDHGLNDVEWVSMMPDCRGKGYGAALTWAATLAEPTLPAALIASDDGFSIYRRMGYEPLLRLTLWFRGEM
jgi:hypothetical protein